MVKYTIRRFVEMLFTLFVIATGTFFLLAAVPGDALTARADKLPEKVRVNLYKRYGLDKPLLERYGITMKGMLKGDFGESVIYEGETVSNIIKTKGPVSARLGIQQMLLGVGLGLLLGILAATRKGTWIDYSIVFFSILLISSRLWYPASESLCRKPTLIPDDRMAERRSFYLVVWRLGVYDSPYFDRMFCLHRILRPPVKNIHVGCYEPGIYSHCGIQRSLQRKSHPQTCT